MPHFYPLISKGQIPVSVYSWEQEILSSKYLTEFHNY